MPKLYQGGEALMAVLTACSLRLQYHLMLHHVRIVLVCAMCLELGSSMSQEGLGVVI